MNTSRKNVIASCMKNIKNRIKVRLRVVFHSAKFVWTIFQDILKKMRVLDDKIVYALNTSIPTESFQKKIDASSACQDLYLQIQKGHSDRENVIKNCIVATAETVKKLKSAKEEKPDDYEVLKNLKAEQKKLRLLQTELSVEEVIKEKTTKLFVEKCRGYYKPKD